MHFGLTEEQQMIVDATRAFVENELYPHELAVERSGHLPLELIKLDRSLVRTLPDDGEDVAIVQAIIDTSHALGLGVVAEGVETEAQRSLLAALGCDEAQGYLFSQPLPEDQFRANASL